MSTPAELLRALGREARAQERNGSFAYGDHAIRTYRGRSVEDIIPKIQSELGADAIIVRRRDGLAGGVLGFFQHPYVEIEAMSGPEGIDVYDDDEPVGPTDAPAPALPAAFEPPPAALEPPPAAAEPPVIPPLPPQSSPLTPQPPQAALAPQPPVARQPPVTPQPLVAQPPPVPQPPPPVQRPAAEYGSSYVSARLAALARSAPAEGGFRSAPAPPPAAAAQPLPVSPPMVERQLPPRPPVPTPPEQRSPTPSVEPEDEPFVAGVDFHELIAREEPRVHDDSRPYLDEQAARPAYSSPPEYIPTPEYIPPSEYVPPPEYSSPAEYAPPPEYAAAPEYAPSAEYARSRRPAPARERRAVAPGSQTRARVGVEKGLRRVGVSAELARELVDGAAAHVLPLAPRAGLAQAVRTTIAQRMPVAPPLPTRGAAIVVVGAGGTGKTTCCAALLAAYRNGSTLPASFATLTRGAQRDDLRLILAPRIVKPMAAGTPRALGALRRAKDDGLAVVDTPRMSPADKAGIRTLAQLLGALEPERIVVALPATLGAQAAAQLLTALRPLGANAMAVTHADETDQIGVAIEAACAFGLALEYLLDCAPSGAWRLRAVDPVELAGRLLP
jgi:SRP54-type protein, GTPase domain